MRVCESNNGAGPLLELRGVTAGYGDKVLVSDVWASVNGGEMVSVLGANGAGKSTLLRTIVGEIAALGGEVAVCGEPVWGMPARRLALRMSIVNTQRVDVDGLTAMDVAAMGRYPHTGFFGRLSDEDLSLTRAALRRVGMEGMAGRQMRTLSDGERQKVMVARALAQDTAVMVLDEPTAFLDVASRVELNALLGDLARQSGKAVVMTTHDVGQALEQSDRIWLLAGDGRLTDATPAGLIAAHDSGDAEKSPLDRLFADRAVVFDSRRLDYRVKG